jgi:hypothetical protein
MAFPGKEVARLTSLTGLKCRHTTLLRLADVRLLVQPGRSAAANLV